MVSKTKGRKTKKEEEEEGRQKRRRIRKRKKKRTRREGKEGRRRVWCEVPRRGKGGWGEEPRRTRKEYKYET